MFRPLLACALLAVAAPAQSQWLGPTNVFVYGNADVFVSGGRAFAIVWSNQTGSGYPAIEMLGSKQAPPGRIPVAMTLVGIAAFDPRPCARQAPQNPSTLLLNNSAVPPYPWVIQPDGWLWWYEPSSWLRFAPGPYEINMHFLTYDAFQNPFTPCIPSGVPKLIAMLFEISPR